MTRNRFSSTSRRTTMVSTTALVLLTALILPGCSTTPDESTDGEVELTFMNQSRGQEAALTQLAEQYTEETGVRIVIDSPGPADFLPKLQAKAQSNSMPDIYSSFNATDMAAFYRAGWAMDLTEELDAGWADSFSPAIIEMSTFEDGNNLDVPAGIYTAHWETQTYGFLVNEALTGAAADEQITTTDDYIDLLADGTGEAKLSIAASLTPQLIQGLASNWLTDEEIAATFNGEASWEAEGWRKAFEVLAEMRDAGVIANNTLPGGQGDNSEVESQFFTQSLGSMFNASPGVSVGFRTNPEFEDYFAVGVLKDESGTEEPRSPGVPGKGAVINPKADHPEEALAFVKWLTEPTQQAVFAEVGRILPSNPELLADGDIPPQLAGFAASVEQMQVMSATFATDVKTAIVAESQRLVLGEATVDEVLANIQAAQERSS